MRGWKAKTVMVLLAVWATAAGLFAQAPGPGGNVTSIAVEPAPGRAAESYRGLIRQKLDTPLDRGAIQASLRALFASGEFAAVEAVIQPVSAGWALRFVTQPRYFISLLRVENSPGPPNNAELADVSGLNLGEVYDSTELQTAMQAMLARLRGYGYYQALITPGVVLDRSQASASVRFTVDAGSVARLGSMTWTGQLAATPAQLLRVSGLKPGEKYSRERLDGATGRIQAFYARRGRLTAAIGVSVARYDPIRNRVALAISVTAGPLIRVETEGMKLPAGVLRNRVPVFQEHAADLGLIEEGRGNLVRYLQGRGYFEAKVQYRRTTTASGDVDIIYTIAPGPKEVLDRITFAGNHYFESDDLRQHVTLRAASRWMGPVPGARGRFSESAAQGDAAALARLYRQNGFAEVEVTPEIERSAAFEPGRERRIAVRFVIVEGPQTLVGARRIEGANAAQQAALAQLLTTAAGQPYSPAGVAADRNAILTYYYNLGYQRATCEVQSTLVDPEDDPVESTAGGAAGPRETVVFTVRAGERLSVHRVLISGERHVRRNVIANRIVLHDGAPLSQAAMLSTQSRLYNTGLFTSVHVVARNAGGSDSAKDVQVSVQEARRWTFSEGVGLQVQGGTGGAPNRNDVLGHTGISPLLSFDVTRTAMTGRAQTLSFRSTYGTLQKRAVVGYAMPDFLNREALRADWSAFYDDTYDVRTFRAIREQAGWQLAQSLNPAEGWTYNFNLQRVRVLAPLVAAAEGRLLGQPVAMGEVAATYHLDHRDNPLDTHRGVFDSVQFSLTKTFNPVFANFGRVDWQTHWYHPLGHEGGVVLAGSTQIGVEFPFGRKQSITLTNPVNGAEAAASVFLVPLPERFLSGGPDSLRGYSINQAGPRDPITGFPVGGEALLINNLELRFPLIGASLGGVGFYDLGNVYSTPAQLLRSLGRWRPPSAQLGAPAPGAALLNADSDFTSHTAGLGVRYRTPVGPVRVDFGYLLNPPVFHYFTSGTPAQVLTERLPRFHFFFSVGQTF